MRKNKFLFILAFVFCASSFFFLNQSVAKASESYTEISSASQLSQIGKDASFPLDGNYKLTSDINFALEPNFAPIGLVLDAGNESEVLPFSGIFDGNGYKISNLTLDSQSVYFHFGLFAKLQNATVKNLMISNLTISNANVFSPSITNAYTIYVGGLAAISQSSTIHTSSISFSVATHELFSSAGALYFGGITGKALAGTSIKNVFAENSFKWTLATEQMDLFTGGGLVGSLENSTVQNSIVKAKMLLETQISSEFESKLTINAGSISGDISGQTSKAISTYSDFIVRTDYTQTAKTNIGALIGVISSSATPESENISYNQLFARTQNLGAENTTQLTKVFGQKNNYLDTTSQFGILAQNSFAVFTNENLWPGYENQKWNGQSVWILSGVSMPELQVFSSYEIMLKIQDTRIHLTQGIAPQEILEMDFLHNSGAVIFDNDGNVRLDAREFRYSEEVKISVTIKENFNSYYELASVELDGTTKFEFGKSSQTFAVEKNEAEVGAYTITFSASNAVKGGISVTLGKIDYELIVMTKDTEMGRVQIRNSSVTNEALSQNVSTANIYEFVAVPKNNQIAFSKWIIEVPVIVNGEVMETEFTEFELGEYAQRSLIRFEFGASGEQDITQQIIAGGRLVAIFTNNVTHTTIKIEEKTKGEDIRAGYVAYTIGGEEVDISNPIAYEKNKAQTFIAVARDGYKFVGWYDDAGRSVSSMQTFEWTPTSLEDNFVLRAVFEDTRVVSSGALLWIILGSVVGLGGLVALIIVIKRRTSDNSYRNFY